MKYVTKKLLTDLLGNDEVILIVDKNSKCRCFVVFLGREVRNSNRKYIQPPCGIIKK